MTPGINPSPYVTRAIDGVPDGTRWNKGFGMYGSGDEKRMEWDSIWVEAPLGKRYILLKDGFGMELHAMTVPGAGE